MKAWKLTAPKNFEAFESASEKAEAGCVKIKIRQYLVTKPDVQTYLGNSAADLPVIPGGSCCGMVVETGEGVEDFVRGDRVYVHPQKYCGVCSACRSGKFSACENLGQFGITDDGFLRDFAVIRAANCTKIPDRIADNEAVFLDYISLAVQTLNTMDAEKGEFIAISGATTLGIVLAQVALYYQTVPILIDSDEQALELARSFGIYYAINSAAEDPVRKIMHITGGKMAECVAHIASGAVPAEQSMKYIGRNGRFIIVGRFASRETMTVSLAPIMKNGVSIVGVTDGAKNTQVAVNMLANKAVSVLPFIEKTVKYEDIPQVFEEKAKDDPSPMKTLAEFD